MKIIPAIIACICCVAASFARGDGERVRAVGVLSVEVFPGRPNYESIKNGDAADTEWILTVAVDNQKEKFQLEIDYQARDLIATLRRAVGKKLIVDGVIWQANLGTEHTPFIIRVKTIKEEPNQRPLRMALAVMPTAGQSARQPAAHRRS
jgi:hypothetical protein